MQRSNAFHHNDNHIPPAKAFTSDKYAFFTNRDQLYQHRDKAHAITMTS